MDQDVTVTLTPEEALRLGLMRPIAEQNILKPIGKAFTDYAENQNFGSSSFILTLLQVVYNAGMIEGIRSERKRKQKNKPLLNYRVKADLERCGAKRSPLTMEE